MGVSRGCFVLGGFVLLWLVDALWLILEEKVFPLGARGLGVVGSSDVG